MSCGREKSPSRRAESETGVESKFKAPRRKGAEGNATVRGVNLVVKLDMNVIEAEPSVLR